MATIDTITKIDGGYTYTFSASGVDIWLDGARLEENWADTEYTIYTRATRPPEIEITAYGTRCTNSYACRRMGIQWYAGNYGSFAVCEYRSGTLYSTRYVDVAAPDLYGTTTVNMAASDSVAQYWTVRPAVKYGRSDYAIVGYPVQITARRYYLPPAPSVTYAYNASTQILTVSST